MRRGPKPKDYDLELAAAWFRAVVYAGGKRVQCVACDRRAVEAHHAIPKTHIESFCRSARLTNEERNTLLWHVENGVPLCRDCHERHTNASRRLLVENLPKTAWAFAMKLNVLAIDLNVRGYGAGWATERLRREYPG